MAHQEDSKTLQSRLMDPHGMTLKEFTQVMEEMHVAYLHIDIRSASGRGFMLLVSGEKTAELTALVQPLMERWDAENLPAPKTKA